MEKWQGCHSSVKRSQNALKIDTRGIFGSGRSNMTSDFEIDQKFINYSYMMTHCPFSVKQGQNALKIGTRGIFGSGRSNGKLKIQGIKKS